MADITQMIADLREMVASSINPDNGLKSITGAATNLAFNAVIDAIEEAAKTGGGGGGATLKAYLTVDDQMNPILPSETQMAANIKVLEGIRDAALAGADAPFFTIDIVSNGKFEASCAPMMSTYSETDDPVVMASIFMGEMTLMVIFLEDGSVDIQLP